MTEPTETKETPESGPMKQLRKQMKAAEERATKALTELADSHVRQAGGDPTSFLGRQVVSAFLGGDGRDDFGYDAFDKFAKDEGVEFTPVKPSKEEPEPEPTADATGAMARLRAAQNVSTDADLDVTATRETDITKRLEVLSDPKQESGMARTNQREAISLQNELVKLRKARTG